jgi:hypothetical protein
LARLKIRLQRNLLVVEVVVVVEVVEVVANILVEVDLSKCNRTPISTHE